MARPEGQRCILEASEGRTVTRARNGALMHKFSSPLPNGSPATGASQVQLVCISVPCLMQCQQLWF